MTPFNALDVLKTIKCGNFCGVDGISTEHFRFTFYCPCYFLHGYLPDMYTKTTRVTIIYNKTGNTCDQNNYRPISLATAASNILCLSAILENYGHVQQFGFKINFQQNYALLLLRV